MPGRRWRFQLDNHLGTATLEVDHEGNVISYEEYHPYGTSAVRVQRSTAGFSQKRYRYTGKERDEETALYYHGARYYAPWLGRWTSADPAGMVDGPNLYCYVQANPATNLDPSGTQTSEPEGWTDKAWGAVKGFFRGVAKGLSNAGQAQVIADVEAERNRQVMLKRFGLSSDKIIQHREEVLQRAIETSNFESPEGTAESVGFYVGPAAISLGAAYVTGKATSRSTPGAVPKSGTAPTPRANPPPRPTAPVPPTATPKPPPAKPVPATPTAPKARPPTGEVTLGTPTVNPPSSQPKALPPGPPPPKALPPASAPPQSLPASRVGHVKPWAEMSQAERNAFKHSYSRHGKELGLPAWSEKNAADLQMKFNDIVGYIRTQGTVQPGPIYKPFGGKSVEVTFYEAQLNGTKYYYYEERATGKFISAGKAR